MEYRNYNDITRDIIELRTKVFIEEQGVPIEEEIEADEGRYLHCCIYQRLELIAYARVSLTNPIGIGRVCVQRKYRNQGYGKKIMQYAELQIPMHSVEIQIHAQAHAQSFYEALGYIAYGQRFMEAGIEHIAMKKNKA